MTGESEYGGRLDVSRETLDRLKLYESLLLKWNPRINLVSAKSLTEAWTRHFIDSTQVYDLAGPWKTWVDLGSGGGFPGLVVAILAAERNPDGRVTLIESDQRKAAFLRTAARECNVPCRVVSKRIEQADPEECDVISARALADLGQLLEFSQRHLLPGGVAVFPKGVSWKKEVDNARRDWQFDLEHSTSSTEPGAAILKITGITRV